MASVLPFVNLVVDPAVLDGTGRIAALHRALGEPEHGTFVVIAGLASTAAVVLSSLASMLSQALATRFSATCQERLGSDLIRLCLSAPYAWFLGQNAQLLARYFHNHLVVWSRDVIRRIFLIVNQAFLVLLPAALLLVFAPALGAAVLAGVVVLTGALLAFVRQRTRRFIALKGEAEDRSTMLASETMAGIKDIKLSSRERVFAGLFTRSYHMFARANARANIWSLLPVGVAVLLGQLTLILVAYLFWHAGLSPGEITAQIALVVLVTSRIVPASNQLSASILSLWGMIPWTDALYDLHRTLVQAGGGMLEQDVVRAAPWRAVAFHGVSFHYPENRFPAVRDLSFRLEQGRAYAFVGPSGAGKSTAIDILLGLLVPSDGQVQVDGRPLAEFGAKAWQAGIGYVPQSPFVADDTIRANVAFGVKPEDIDDATVSRCLEMAMLGETLRGLPDGLDTRLGDRGTRLSGGQRQRVAIARALYNKPDLLVLDEATSALDSISEAGIRDAIAALAGRVTTVTIAHRLSTVRHCDAIFLMSDGHVVAVGTWDELHRSSSLFRQLAASGDDAVTAGEAAQ